MPNWNWLGWVVSLVLIIGSGPAHGASVDRATVGLAVDIASAVALTITPNSISFPSADPDSTPSIPSTPNSISVTCDSFGSGHYDLYLHVRANSDLVSGGNSIPIGQVSWTATGEGFLPGTMSLAQQQAGYWAATGHKTYRGQFYYFLKNNWNYAIGNYTATVTYTLTSP